MFLQGLFQGTSLFVALLKVSSKKTLSIGLKHGECKLGRGGKKPPIHYIWDLVQEAQDMKPVSLKFTLTNGSETWVMVWSGYSTNEQFLQHVNTYNTTPKLGLIPANNNATEVLKKNKWVKGSENEFS